MTPEQQQASLDYVRQNPAEFTDFNIPWSVQAGFSLSFFNTFNTATYRYTSTTTASISIQGDFSLSPKWKVGGNGFYDFNTKKIQTLTMFISRDMHCWQLSINLVPVGLTRSFNISLSPKSGILRDLRINRSRWFYNN
jgi:LPS-assembly protein